MKILGFSLVLLAFFVTQNASSYVESPLDQVAEEGKQHPYVTHLKAPDDILKRYTHNENKYGNKKKNLYPHYDKSQIPIIENQKQNKERYLPQTNLTDRHKTISQLSDPFEYVVSVNKEPSDVNDFDSIYNGWMPIIPILQDDNYITQRNIKPILQISTSRTILQDKSFNVPYGHRTTIQRKPRIYQYKIDPSKVALKRASSSTFSDKSSEENANESRDSYPSDSHHVHYKTKVKHHHHHHHHKYVKTIVKKVPVEVPVIVHKPYPVEKKVPYPVEKIVHKVVEKKVPYPVEKKVPYPVEVKVPKPYPVKVIEKEYIPKPYPVIKHVPIIKHVEVKVPVPKPVPYPVEKKVPYPVEVKVPYPVEKKVPYPVEVEKKVPYPVKVYVPKPVTVEKKVPYPVEVKVKEPYPVIKHVPVPVKVYVDKPYPVEVPKPYPVEVEKKVPYPVEVEKKVPIPVKVYVPHPVPVEKPIPILVHDDSKAVHEHVEFGDTDLFKESFI